MLMFATTFSIFLHPTDLSVAAFVILTVFLLKGEITMLGLFAISLLTVWSNNPVFSIISGFIIFSIYWILRTSHPIKTIFVAAIVSGIPAIFAFVSINLPDTENFLRNASNYFGLFLLMVILLNQILLSGTEEKRKDISQLGPQ
jgi:hypothetical protein